MKLSIGMIVKNEEKYLEQCLTAIKPILVNVDSELIITDTGSTDRTVEIAKKFTDNVTFYEWNKDFAAARSVALKAARGEWFMYLDADEIFSSCDGIINFFNSGQYKKYKTATYIIRNVVDNDGEYYDMIAYRMCKKLQDTSFEGVIHEHLSPLLPPLIDIKDVAVHYGYLHESDESRKKKADRNLELLLKEYDKCVKNNDPMIYGQICDCYVLVGNYDLADVYLKRGIDYCKKNNSIYLAMYYNNMIIHELRKDNVESALSLCDEYFDYMRSIRVGRLTTDMEIYAIKATVLYEHFNFLDALNTYKIFFEFFDLVKSGKVDTEDASALQIKFATDRNYVKHVYSFVDCCIVCNDFNTAVEYLTTLPVYKYSENKEYVSILVGKEIAILDKTGFEKAYECYRQLDEYGKDGFINRLIRELYRSEYRKKIVSAMMKIGKDVPWLKEKSAIYSTYISDSAVDKCIIENFIKKYGIQDHIDLVKIVLEKNVDLSCILDAESVDLKACVFACCKYLDAFYSFAESYDMSSMEKSETLKKAAVFYKYIMETALLGNDIAKKNVEFLLPRFAESGTLYMSRTGLSESELPEILRAAVIADDVVKLKNENKYKECISEIKHAIAVYHPIAAVMAGYSKLVIEEYDKVSKAVKPKTEMEILAEVIKKNIRAYIAARNYDAARKTLAEYKMIVPNDPEIDIISEDL